MPSLHKIYFLLMALVTGYFPTSAQKPLKQFIFFSQDREGIHDSAFYNNPGVAGAQITYPWKRLEQGKGKYDFSEIEEDLKFLQTKGKRLFIQIQDVTFDTSLNVVPHYLLTDTAYHGGADPDYDNIPDGDESRAVKGGWVSRRWDTAVAAQYHKLLIALGHAFDGRVEGINLPESSIELGTSGKLFPSGFSFEKYRDALMENMRVLKNAFPRSTPIQYANFFPGGSHAYLNDLFVYAQKIKIGMGGPDIKVYRKAQMDNSYPLIRALDGIVPTGAAVQDGNYDIINVKTGKQVTVPEILDFAVHYLHLNYIFWCTEEPYYSRDVLPMLRNSVH